MTVPQRCSPQKCALRKRPAEWASGTRLKRTVPSFASPSSQDRVLLGQVPSGLSAEGFVPPGAGIVSAPSLTSPVLTAHPKTSAGVQEVYPEAEVGGGPRSEE